MYSSADKKNKVVTMAKVGLTDSGEMKMAKIKRYIDIYIPTETCNLRCHYCYIAQKNKFNSQIAKFSHSPATIRQALSVKRLGGVCLLNFCAGGETLLSAEVLPVVKELLLEGHYVMMVTNGTVTQRFNEMAQWPEELRSHLFIKFSFHYLEMKRLGWLNKFVDNVHRIKSAKISFTIEVTPSDELIPYIEELKGVCMSDFGAFCHVTIARDDRTKEQNILSRLTFDEYKKIWSQFDSPLFDFKSKIFGHKRNEFCYGGEWSLYLNLETGKLNQCYREKTIDNIYKNINEPIHFEAIGNACSAPHCYNGHSFIAFGTIPELEAPTYAEERNRVCSDGSEWLQPAMKEFMSSRLYDSNKEYDETRKLELRRKQTSAIKTWIRHLIGGNH